MKKHILLFVMSAASLQAGKHGIRTLRALVDRQASLDAPHNQALLKKIPLVNNSGTACSISTPRLSFTIQPGETVHLRPGYVITVKPIVEDKSAIATDFRVELNTQRATITKCYGIAEHWFIAEIE